MCMIRIFDPENCGNFFLCIRKVLQKLVAKLHTLKKETITYLYEDNATKELVLISQLSHMCIDSTTKYTEISWLLSDVYVRSLHWTFCGPNVCSVYTRYFFALRVRAEVPGRMNRCFFKQSWPLIMSATSQWTLWKIIGPCNIFVANSSLVTWQYAVAA